MRRAVRRAGEGEGAGATAGLERGRGGAVVREWERKELPDAMYTLFAECPRSDTRQRYFFFILKYTLSSGLDPALGKGFFAECPPGDTRQRLFHYTLPSVHTLTLGKGFFAECHFWTLGKVHFYFFISQPNLLWYVPTLCRPTCTILGQLEKCFL
jgi:hypothetical protein